MKTIKLYKKYKKLAYGGNEYNPEVGQALSTNEPNAAMGAGMQGVGSATKAIPVYGQFTDMAKGTNSMIRQDNQYGVAKSDTAAGVGAIFNPSKAVTQDIKEGNYGQAFVSAIDPFGSAYRKNQKMARLQADAEEKYRISSTLSSQREKFNNAIEDGLQVQGNMNQQKYAKNGGLLYKNGGNVQKLSKTNVQFNGNSHENGGIKEPLVNGVRLDGTEVEGNESMSTSNGQKFVFSENLGFAQQHKPLAKAMGKIEKKLKANPNDPISTRTLNTLKEREEQLKVKQEETKEALGLENNLGEMKLGGAIKRKDGVYIDREGVMKYPLKNGGLYKAENGLPNYTFRNTRTAYVDPNYTSVLPDGSRTNQVGLDDGNRAYTNSTFPIASTEQSISPYNYKSLPNASVLGGSNLNPSASVKDSSVGGPNSLEGLPGKGATDTGTTGSRVNWGNLAGNVAPYVGAFTNAMLNEQARKMGTPKEDLPDYIKYKPVDYTVSKLEADIQRRQLNKNLTQNVTNSAVAAALKAKNLGTTLGVKNSITQEENNINTQGINNNRLLNSNIQQKRNQIDVENRDRDYNKEQRYLTQKGEIANNFSDIYQKTRRDSKLYDLEDRKIDVLAKQDAARDVWYRNFLEDQKKQKESHKNGGLIKKPNKLYSKLRK